MNIKVFSYGSNMCRQRMQARVPSARFLTTGYLTGYRLRFHKRCDDGSSKADAWYTGRADHRIWGVLFEVARTEKPILDECESLGNGYEEVQVDVQNGRRSPLSAWMYVAQSHFIHPDLKPYTWYHRFVVTGARQHNLPEDYIRFLQEHPAVADPDPFRHRANTKIIVPGTP